MQNPPCALPVYKVNCHNLLKLSLTSLGLNLMNSPGTPFANCDLSQHYWKRLKTNAIHSNLLKITSEVFNSMLKVCSAKKSYFHPNPPCGNWQGGVVGHFVAALSPPRPGFVVTEVFLQSCTISFCLASSCTDLFEEP